MKNHFRNTKSISVTYLLLSLFITYVSAHSLLRQITDDLNKNLQQEEVHYLPKHQEISSRDYIVSASNTVKGLSDRRPSTYSLKIESFNTLLKSTVLDKYETRPFSAGGYNWTLLVYPNGNKKDDGSGYLSLYVAIDKSSLVDVHQEVYADLRFYIFNKNERKYFTIQDLNVWRFNAFNTMWGFSHVLPVDTFKDPTNGYLYDGDHCEFGVDVIIPTPFEKSELFSVSWSSEKFTWSIPGFSKLFKDSYLSDVFSLGGRKWQLDIFPNGRGTARGKAVSLFLGLNGNQRTGDYELVYVLAKLRVLNQRKLNDLEKKFEFWYGRNFLGGFEDFISFEDLKDSSKGFLVNDILMVQVELMTISTTKYFPS